MEDKYSEEFEKERLLWAKKRMISKINSIFVTKAKIQDYRLEQFRDFRIP
jgi:hypothetical protein